MKTFMALVIGFFCGWKLKDRLNRMFNGATCDRP